MEDKKEDNLLELISKYKNANGFEREKIASQLIQLPESKKIIESALYGWKKDSYYDLYYSIALKKFFEATLNFDHTTNIKFSTYASKVIKNGVLDEHEKNRKNKTEYINEENQSSITIDPSNDNAETLQLLFELLDSNEQEIMKYNYGILGYDKLNQEEIGEQLELSPSRVSQILTGANRKLAEFNNWKSNNSDPGINKLPLERVIKIFKSGDNNGVKNFEDSTDTEEIKPVNQEEKSEENTLDESNGDLELSETTQNDIVLFISAERTENASMTSRFDNFRVQKQNMIENILMIDFEKILHLNFDKIIIHNPRNVTLAKDDILKSLDSELRFNEKTKVRLIKLFKAAEVFTTNPKQMQTFPLNFEYLLLNKKIILLEDHLDGYINYLFCYTKKNLENTILLDKKYNQSSSDLRTRFREVYQTIEENHPENIYEDFKKYDDIFLIDLIDSEIDSIKTLSENPDNLPYYIYSDDSELLDSLFIKTYNNSDGEKEIIIVNNVNYSLPLRDYIFIKIYQKVDRNHLINKLKTAPFSKKVIYIFDYTYEKIAKPETTALYIPSYLELEKFHWKAFVYYFYQHHDDLPLLEILSNLNRRNPITSHLNKIGSFRGLREFTAALNISGKSITSSDQFIHFIIERLQEYSETYTNSLSISGKKCNIIFKGHLYELKATIGAKFFKEIIKTDQEKISAIELYRNCTGSQKYLKNINDTLRKNFDNFIDCTKIIEEKNEVSINLLSDYLSEIKKEFLDFTSIPESIKISKKISNWKLK